MHRSGKKWFSRNQFLKKKHGQVGMRLCHGGRGGIKLVRMITPKCSDAIPGAEMNRLQGKLGFEEK